MDNNTEVSKELRLFVNQSFREPLELLDNQQKSMDIMRTRVFQAEKKKKEWEEKVAFNNIWVNELNSANCQQKKFEEERGFSEQKFQQMEMLIAGYSSNESEDRNNQININAPMINFEK